MYQPRQLLPVWSPARLTFQQLYIAPGDGQSIQTMNVIQTLAPQAAAHIRISRRIFVRRKIHVGLYECCTEFLWDC